ncbi:MAG: DUF3810 domain-containing protein [Proteiniphilum sp.]|nr:DUF3810 domain-containing protein [Proteiniphilum sp.]
MTSKCKGGVTGRQFARLSAIAGTLCVTVYIFSRSAALSEWYMCTVYPGVAAILSFVSGLCPFSLYDVFLIVAALLLIALTVFAAVRKIAFSRFLFLLIRFVTVVAAWFYFSWGIAYFRKDFYARSGAEEVTFDREIFKDFAIRFIDRANRCYVDCPETDRVDVQREVESSYRALCKPLHIPYPNGRRRVKPMMFEAAYSKMGVSGYFGPLFSEIHVNGYGLSFSQPFTLAHEMAHQFGIATESEANLYAFAVCSGSSSGSVRYSAYASTLRYVLNDIRRFLPEEYASIVSRVRPEIMADLQRNREHWLAARNETLSDVQDRVYDAYLKTNGVTSGRASYSEVVSLLVSYGIEVDNEK